MSRMIAQTRMLLDYLRSKMSSFKENEKENPCKVITMNYSAQHMLDEKYIHAIEPVLYEFL